MPEDELTAFADTLLQVRLARVAHFPAEMLRGEQVWNLLLILFIADGRGSRVSGRIAIEKEGGSLEVGRRWLKYLTRLQYILGDGDGNLDDTLTMTPACVHKVEQWLRDARRRLAELPVIVPLPQ